MSVQNQTHSANEEESTVSKLCNVLSVCLFCIQPPQLSLNHTASSISPTSWGAGQSEAYSTDLLLLCCLFKHTDPLHPNLQHPMQARLWKLEFEENKSCLPELVRKI